MQDKKDKSGYTINITDDSDIAGVPIPEGFYFMHVSDGKHWRSMQIPKIVYEDEKEFDICCSILIDGLKRMKLSC